MKKCCLFVLGVCRGYAYLRTAQCDGDTRKPCPGPKIQERANSGGNSPGAGNRLDEMPGEDAFLPPNSGQIQPRIPAHEQRQVRLEAVSGFRVEFGQTRCSQQLVEPGIQTPLLSVHGSLRLESVSARRGAAAMPQRP